MKFNNIPEQDQARLIDALHLKLKYFPKDLIKSELKFNNPELTKINDGWLLSDADDEQLEGWLSFGGI